MKQKQILLIGLIFIIFISVPTLSLILNETTVTRIDSCKITYYNENVWTYDLIDKIGTCTPYPLNNSCMDGYEQYQEKEYYYNIIPRQRKVCKAIRYRISITKNFKQRNYNIDFSKWGMCEYSTKDGCRIITCVSENDGYHKGEPVKCPFGATCQKFIVCNNKIKTLYKHNSNEFKDVPVNFYQKKLKLKE